MQHNTIKACISTSSLLLGSFVKMINVTCSEVKYKDKSKADEEKKRLTKVDPNNNKHWLNLCCNVLPNGSSSNIDW